MTNEEAIRILEYEIYKYAKERDEQEDSTKYRDSVNMALVALRAQQTRPLDRSRWEGCPVCVTNGCETCKYTYCQKDEYPCCDCSHIKKYEPDGFCPTCGRPLTEEAWADLERRIGGNDGTADN